MYVNIYKDADELSSAAAEWIADQIEKKLSKKEIFTLALSGGETPKKLFQKLAAEPYKEKIDWNKIHIFWGDERVVPPDDERNNAKMAFDYLLNKVAIPPGQIHRINTELEPAESVKQYEKILHKYFGEDETTFDLVLLGMGDDGHTLSIFPGHNIKDQEAWVKADYVGQKGVKRITLLPSVVNKSAAVAFLITGENKAKILQQVIEDTPQQKYPAQLIQPANGELYWFLDEAAARYLQK